MLASLNHPNIAAIYGFDDSGAIRFLVMELVDGKTLADRLEGRRAVPIAEAAAIARQIADALEAAHESGIVHRDLKPANITLRPDGTVKVLDFGLAKVLEPALVVGRRYFHVADDHDAGDDTARHDYRHRGVTCRPSRRRVGWRDKRSDVWAFGCVLYEMLAGRRAFEGEDVPDTLANVLKVDPDWRALPADVPAPIRILITRCLAKDWRQRISDISVAQFTLSEEVSLAATQPPASSVANLAAPKLRRPAAIAVAAALMVALLAGAVAWRFRPARSTPAVARFFNHGSGRRAADEPAHHRAVAGRRPHCLHRHQSSFRAVTLGIRRPCRSGHGERRRHHQPGVFARRTVNRVLLVG